LCRIAITKPDQKGGASLLLFRLFSLSSVESSRIKFPSVPFGFDLGELQLDCYCLFRRTLLEDVTFAIDLRGVLVALLITEVAPDS